MPDACRLSALSEQEIRRLVDIHVKLIEEMLDDEDGTAEFRLTDYHLASRQTVYLRRGWNRIPINAAEAIAEVLRTKPEWRDFSFEGIDCGDMNPDFIGYGAVRIRW